MKKVLLTLSVSILLSCTTSRTDKSTKNCKGRNITALEFKTWPLLNIDNQRIQNELLISDSEFSETQNRQQRRQEIPELNMAVFPDHTTVQFDEQCPLEFHEAGHDGDFYFFVTCGTKVKNVKAKFTFPFLILAHAYENLSPDDDSIYFRCRSEQYWHNKKMARKLLKTKKGTRFTGTFGVSHLDGMVWLLIDKLTILP